MLKFLTFLFLFIGLVWAAKPMESITNYNVVLVHGASDMRNGLDCSDPSIGHSYSYKNDSTGYLDIIGGYGSAWLWDGDFHGGFAYQGKSDGAAFELKGLREWLTEDIFEDDKKRTVYLQRPFVKPANSPFDNAKELGKRTWKGENRCENRRSLIEEAQEVRAKGRDSLSKYRSSIEYRDNLPPSRNIIIAHSMGGVAAREYVQGSDYNYDVDKVITLDTPHEGTQALSLLVDMHENWGMNVFTAAGQILTWGLAAAVKT